ncbi:MAG: hypothetical protein QG619_971, partial [Pseudomonadota bacterium]|nr:hypothetical protein [Pseudomonadota bacterium]
NRVVTEYQRYLISTTPIQWRTEILPPAQSQPFESPNLGLVVELLLEYERSVNRPPLKKALKEAVSISDFLQLSRVAALPTVGELVADERGVIYVGADFGQIRMRATSGEWSSIDTGSPSPVTAVFSKADQLLAGTQRGEILAKQSSAADWKLLNSLPANEVIIDIDRANNGRWFIVAAHAKPSRFPGVLDVESVRLYSALDEKLSDLQMVKSIESKWSFGWAFSLAVRGQVIEDAYFLNTISEVEKFDTATMRMETLGPGHPISQFRVSSSGNVLTGFRNQGAFSKLSVSFDRAKTWVEMERPPYTVNDLIVNSQHSAHATRWSAGLFSASMEFLRFDAEKNEWLKLAEATPDACRRTLMTQDGAMLFCISRGGSILRFNGSNLVVEFASD